MWITNLIFDDSACRQTGVKYQTEIFLSNFRPLLYVFGIEIYLKIFENIFRTSYTFHMKNQNKSLKNIANFIYEAGILNKTPRSGLWFLGTGAQSVSEHIFRTTVIGYALSELIPRADKNKVILLCLIHDLGESRTSDLNYVHQKYGRLAESQAVEDIAKSLPFGANLKSLHKEAKERKTLEAKIAKDADNLEWMATLREEFDKGNFKAKSWIELAYKRLKTPQAKKLGKLLTEIKPDDWWFNEKDKWFIDRKPETKKWKSK